MNEGMSEENPDFCYGIIIEELGKTQEMEEPEMAGQFPSSC
jgi:hypothetical protein